ncbi:helix-turn-helix domain-containing protein [Staphylococcus pettenkoferi]|uniref:helix-turn-helix domain-containing protein n=1 Tax=Staphylococcus pettenkoferi TaxID=170573 RepID=UPI00227344F1|nr:helix-turn-helix domain-containing protein [Staphylococcus pettenkoferi]MCY1563858.1 helix-turn-helix domain-containing protein [Staphylococcus pettenkoferi]
MEQDQILDKSEKFTRPFVKAYNEIIKNLSGNEVKTYLYLKTFAYYGNKVFPSFKKISEDTHLSVPTIHKVINTLKDKGFLKIEKKKVKRGYQNLYLLLDPYEEEFYKRKAKEIRKTKEENEGIKQQNEENKDVATRDKNIGQEFEEWWDLYDKKVDKKAARTKFKTARKQYSYETIVKGTKAYLKTIRDKQYQKYPKTFLYNETFAEEHIVNNGKGINDNESDEERLERVLGDL